MRAAIAREDRQKRFFAAMFANVLNVQLPKRSRVTVDELLGVQKETSRTWADMSDEEKKAVLEKHRKKIEAKIAKQKKRKK